MEFGERWEALVVQSPLWDTSQPLGGRPLADGRAVPLEDELHVAGILTPLVEGHHRAFMRRQEALRVPPLLNQSVPAGPPWDEEKQNFRVKF